MFSIILKIMIKSILLTVSSIVSAAQASDYCQINDHWVNVTRLPYVEGEIHQCQYAGTLNVSKPGTDHHLFYWFFKHQDPQAPLLVWLNGGPGATSMFGLFLENGPLRVRRNGTGPDDFVMTAADASWADQYNIIFLDQPVGTGFSFGDSALTSMKDGSEEFLKFILEFLKKYPEFKKRPMFLTGESYAGKYLPLFTSELLAWNEKMRYFADN